MSKLYIIGVGPGSKDYITPLAKFSVEDSDITIGSKRAIDLFPETKEKIYLNVKDVQEKLKLGVELASSGKNVSILSTGDPGFSGVLKPVKKIIRDEKVNNIKLEVIPGISSLQLATAKLGLSWDDANIMTFHGREDFSILIDILNNGNPTIFLPSRSVKDMAKFLLDNGIDGDRRVAICERLSYSDEKIVNIPLKKIMDSEFSYMCVIVIY